MKKKGLKAFLALALFLGMACHHSSPELPVYGKIPSFRLVNQNQQAFSSQDLQGKIWVANFIFTSCRTVCPLLTQRMKGIQDVLQKMAEQNPKIPAHLVSFSVDPERDTPAKLLAFAQKFGVNLQWWTFLTGPLDEVTHTVVQGFKISMWKIPIPTPAGKTSSAEVFEIVHGEKFILVDEQGQIRGYYDSDPPSIQRLVNDLKQLVSSGKVPEFGSSTRTGSKKLVKLDQAVGEEPNSGTFPEDTGYRKGGLMNWGDDLATLNAVLNGTAFILLFSGWRAIRAKRVSLHKKCMVSAFIVSILFLISYLTRFYLTGVHRFPGGGMLKTLYLSILMTHTILAATIPFLAVRTLYLALKGRFESHKKIARFTLPVWMYVSATGVVIYWMLYRF